MHIAGTATVSNPAGLQAVVHMAAELSSCMGSAALTALSLSLNAHQTAAVAAVLAAAFGDKTPPPPHLLQQQPTEQPGGTAGGPPSPAAAGANGGTEASSGRSQPWLRGMVLRLEPVQAAFSADGSSLQLFPNVPMARGALGGGAGEREGAESSGGSSNGAAAGGGRCYVSCRAVSATVGVHALDGRLLDVVCEASIPQVHLLPGMVFSLPAAELRIRTASSRRAASSPVLSLTQLSPLPGAGEAASENDQIVLLGGLGYEVSSQQGALGAGSSTALHVQSVSVLVPPAQCQQLLGLLECMARQPALLATVQPQPGQATAAVPSHEPQKQQPAAAGPADMEAATHAFTFSLNSLCCSLYTPPSAMDGQQASSRDATSSSMGLATWLTSIKVETQLSGSRYSSVNASMGSFQLVMVRHAGKMQAHEVSPVIK